MDKNELEELLNGVKDGNIEISTALMRLKTLPFEDLGFAKIDHHRAIRQGYPEVIYGEGKTPIQVAKIVQKMVHHGSNVLATDRKSVV